MDKSKHIVRDGNKILTVFDILPEDDAWSYSISFKDWIITNLDKYAILEPWKNSKTPLC